MFMNVSPNDSADYFSNISSTMSTLNTLAKSSKPRFTLPRLSMPDKLSNELRLRYYQYEVTFGLYMLNSNEKLLLNAIVLTLFSLISFGLFWGLQPFIVNVVCRLVFYISGSLAPAGTVCAPS